MFKCVLKVKVITYNDIHLLINPTYLNWAREASPTLGCSIEISRDIYMYICVSVVCQITWNHVNQTRACSKSVLKESALGYSQKIAAG